MAIFNETLGRIAEQYLKKGYTFHVEGQLVTRKWTDEQGVEKFSTEVVLQQYRGELTLLGSRDNQAQQNQPSVTDNPNSTQKPPTRFEDEVPF